MHAEIYKNLQKHYHKHPLGFPETGTGAEMKILEHLFSPEEAKVAPEITNTPVRAEELAEKLHREPKEVFQLLERMVEKGLILRLGKKGEGRYMMLPFLPGIYEFQLKSLDKELVEEFEALFHPLTREAFGAETSLFRILASEKNLSPGVEILPYERASEVVKHVEKIALADCICRIEQKIAGKGCDQPKDEVCIYFSPWAEQFIERGMGREATVGEALEALERGEKAGLVRIGGNVQWGMQAICQCCPCCCLMLRAITEVGVKTTSAKSSFIPVIDLESCNGCEECLRVCPVKALTLSLKDEKAVLDAFICIGCGVCASACPASSITLKRKPEEEITLPFARPRDLLTAIAQDKGRTLLYK